jgi:hypothetical protein
MKKILFLLCAFLPLAQIETSLAENSEPIKKAGNDVCSIQIANLQQQYRDDSPALTKAFENAAVNDQAQAFMNHFMNNLSDQTKELLKQRVPLAQKYDQARATYNSYISRPSRSIDEEHRLYALMDAAQGSIAHFDPKLLASLRSDLTRSEPPQNSMIAPPDDFIATTKTPYCYNDDAKHAEWWQKSSDTCEHHPSGDKKSDSKTRPADMAYTTGFRVETFGDGTGPDIDEEGSANAIVGMQFHTFTRPADEAVAYTNTHLSCTSWDEEACITEAPNHTKKWYVPHYVGNDQKNGEDESDGEGDVTENSQFVTLDQIAKGPYSGPTTPVYPDESDFIKRNLAAAKSSCKYPTAAQERLSKTAATTETSKHVVDQTGGAPSAHGSAGSGATTAPKTQ